MTKDEARSSVMGAISMALKDSTLQQGFEIICKNLSELEAENAELKKGLSVLNASNSFNKEQLTEAKELIEKLSKSLFLAKGIVRDLIDDTVDFKESKERAIYCYEQEKFDTYKQAEQFLKEQKIMSSTLKTFEGDFLKNPMCIEFSSWIKDSIKWRLEKMGYGNSSQALNDAINKCLINHTNEDYLTCSNSLTSDLEDVLVYHGININDAIRLSWKWSD